MTIKNYCVEKNQRTFRTKLHKMYTIQQNKIALSPLDDKRHIVRCKKCETGACSSCNFQTLAHGHYKLKRERSNDGAAADEPETKRSKTIDDAATSFIA